MTKRRCLITGASSGIGAAFAREFAARGWDLVLTARRADRLVALADEVRQVHGTSAQVIIGDLSDPRTPRRILADIAGPLDGLVNNAGYAPGPDMLGTPWLDHLAFLQIMVAAPTELAQAVAPIMRERRFGRIINVASMLGLTPAAGQGSLYGPVKSYLVRYSEALQAQLSRTGVHVTALCPGFTYTEIFERSGTEQLVKSSIPQFMWQTPEEVVRRGIDACEDNKTICVPGWPNRLNVALLKILPDPVGRAIMNMIGSRVTD